MSTKPYDAAVRRAALPEILFSADVALALDISQVKAELALRNEACGPHFLVCGRPAILRTKFLAALSSRSAQAGRRKEVVDPVRTGRSGQDSDTRTP